MTCSQVSFGFSLHRFKKQFYDYYTTCLGSSCSFHSHCLTDIVQDVLNKVTLQSVFTLRFFVITLTYFPLSHSLSRCIVGRTVLFIQLLSQQEQAPDIGHDGDSNSLVVIHKTIQFYFSNSSFLLNLLPIILNWKSPRILSRNADLPLTEIGKVSEGVGLEGKSGAHFQIC